MMVNGTKDPILRSILRLALIGQCYAALRTLKYEIVSRIPDSKSTFGSQQRSCRARVISGRRTFGSSTGTGHHGCFQGLLYQIGCERESVGLHNRLLDAASIVAISRVAQHLTQKGCEVGNG